MELSCTVPAGCVGTLIGPSGSTARALRDAFPQVHIAFPPRGSASGGGAEPAVVKIAGPHEQGAKAKAAVGDIAKYYHSAATHPGVTHLEYAVPEEHMGQFRGRGSANIRHVQSDSKASVNVPKAWSLNQNVVVVGTAHEVSIAKKHIDKILQQIKDEEEKRERGGDDEDEDAGGPNAEGEEVEEEWMKEYMYKRT